MAGNEAKNNFHAIKIIAQYISDFKVCILFKGYNYHHENFIYPITYDLQVIEHKLLVIP